jgi:HTH-type transcriptional regulator/antitoxin HigA
MPNTTDGNHDMNATAVQHIARHYSALKQLVPLRPIRNGKEYDHAASVLDDLLDAGAADEHSELADLVETVAGFIEDYDDTHRPPPHITGAEAVRFFMQQHGLTQADLPEIGSQGVVSEVLAGKRELNIRQIKALSQRFGVSPAMFM